MYLNFMVVNNRWHENRWNGHVFQSGCTQPDYMYSCNYLEILRDDQKRKEQARERTTKRSYTTKASLVWVIRFLG